MKRKLLVAAVVIACAAAAIYVFANGFDTTLFLASLREINPWWMTASIAISLSGYLFRALRWRVLLNPVRRVDLRPLIESTLIGFSAIFILGRAGEVVRPVWLSRRDSVSFSASVATLIAERFLDMICLVALFAWALLTLDISTEPATVRAIRASAWLALAGFIGGLLALIAFSRWPEMILRLVPFTRVRSLVSGFAEGLGSLKSAGSLGTSLAYSAMVWISISLQFWFLLRSMGFEFSIPAATLVLGVTAIGSLLQIPGIGGGFQAAFMGSLHSFFLVSRERAFAAALVAWVACYLPTIVCTAVYMAVSGFQVRDVRAALSPEQTMSARK
jgi:uncharacterized protein (TIRG00374 family)